MSEPTTAHEPFPGATALVRRVMGTAIGLSGAWILLQALGVHALIGVFLMLYANNLFERSRT